jgi:hypothetical protein
VSQSSEETPAYREATRASLARIAKGFWRILPGFWRILPVRRQAIGADLAGEDLRSPDSSRTD